MLKSNICKIAATFIISLLFLVFTSPSFALDKFGTISTDETWNGEITVTANVTIPTGVTVTSLPGSKALGWE